MGKFQNGDRVEVVKVDRNMVEYFGEKLLGQVGVVDEEMTNLFPVQSDDLVFVYFSKFDDVLFLEEEYLELCEITHLDLGGFSI